MTSSFSSKRPHRGPVSTDPVVVGLGRLLIGVGVLTLAGALTLVCWILRCLGAV